MVNELLLGVENSDLPAVNNVNLRNLVAMKVNVKKMFLKFLYVTYRFEQMSAAKLRV